MYMLVEKTSHCYGHGDYRDIYMLSYGNIAFSTREKADIYAKEKGLFCHVVIEIEIKN